jgi:nitrate reductase gamma subunit
MSFMNLPIANPVIDAGSLIVLLLIILGIVYRVKGGSLHHFFHWQVFSETSKEKTSESNSSSQIGPSFLTILFREVFAFRVLETCNKTKRVSHLAIFWGFVFLGISTTLAFITNPTDIVLPLYDPVKLFGNIGGVLVVVGFLGMFYVRYREDDPIWRLTRSDVFLITLFLAVVTGFVAQQTIYSSMGSEWVSSSFWIHMVFVITLLATAPFTKFFHAISKPISLLYEEIDKRSGVEPLLPEPAAEASTTSKMNKENS